jgi:hypothetical protein
MGKKTGEPNPYSSFDKRISLCVTGKYLWLDLSLLFNAPFGYMVATFCNNGMIECMFHWTVSSSEEMPPLKELVLIPHFPEYNDYFAIGKLQNDVYNRWVTT